MEILGKAARAFLGIPMPRRGNIGTAMLSERFLLEQKARVQQPPKMRETFAVRHVFWRKSDYEREKAADSLKYTGATLFVFLDAGAG